MKHQFQTVSSARKNVIAVAIVWVVLAGLALLGLLVSAVTCIFLEGMLLLVFLFVLFSVSKTKWGLYFDVAGAKDKIAELEDMIYDNESHIEDLEGQISEIKEKFSGEDFSEEDE